MRFGVLGCGSIAATVSATMKHVEGVELYAAASRTKEKAEAFAAANGYQKAYGSYIEMLQDPQVEAVYICTPHNLHYQNMLDCIAHKKHVICEKAFTLNAAQAEDVAKRAAEAGVFVEEAIWTRYMPGRRIINETLESGIIGTPHILTANLSYIISQNRRIVDINLAGGALLDVGVYGINFALMHFGADIERVESSVRMEGGVDVQDSYTIHYRDGRMAVLTHGIYSRGDRRGVIYGDKGYLVVDNINDPLCIDCYDTADKLIRHIDMPDQISGYEYQFAEMLRCIEEGRLESLSMPLEDSIAVMKICDSLRASWGLVYPEER